MTGVRPVASSGWLASVPASGATTYFGPSAVVCQTASAACGTARQVGRRECEPVYPGNPAAPAVRMIKPSSTPGPHACRPDGRDDEPGEHAAPRRPLKQRLLPSAFREVDLQNARAGHLQQRSDSARSAPHRPTEPGRAGRPAPPPGPGAGQSPQRSAVSVHRPALPEAQHQHRALPWREQSEGRSAERAPVGRGDTCGRGHRVPVDAGAYERLRRCCRGGAASGRRGS